MSTITTHTLETPGDPESSDASNYTARAPQEDLRTSGRRAAIIMKTLVQAADVSATIKKNLIHATIKKNLIRADDVPATINKNLIHATIKKNLIHATIKKNLAQAADVPVLLIALLQAPSSLVVMPHPPSLLIPAFDTKYLKTNLL